MVFGFPRPLSYLGHWLMRLSACLCLAQVQSLRRATPRQRFVTFGHVWRGRLSSARGPRAHAGLRKANAPSGERQSDVCRILRAAAVRARSFANFNWRPPRVQALSS
jgi:hypothetical protein